jgi:hypothetical protein
VPASRERLLEAAHEDAVVGLGVPRVHLRDEQDSHLGRIVAVKAETGFTDNISVGEAPDQLVGAGTRLLPAAFFFASS